MAPDLDQRTYDLLRLVDRYGPIGSIQLTELMQLHGYDLKDRTIRLRLAELDELDLTEKVPGQGRRLTQLGRDELERGDVDTRLERLRARIASLASQVTYDPYDDVGVLAASSAFLPAEHLDAALDLVDRVAALPAGPVPIAVEPSGPAEPGDYRLSAASSITVDGVLLARGVDASISNSGLLEYASVASSAEGPSPEAGGRIRRYVDVINGEGSSIDVISLLIESGRTDVSSLLDGADTGILVGDRREFPITRFEEARSLSLATQSALGGVIEVRRPRESEHLPQGRSTWAFGSITYIGPGELVLTALAEHELATRWETLYGTIERAALEPVDAVHAEVQGDD